MEEKQRTKEEIEYSQSLHQQSQKEYDKQQNALCFLVIGVVVLIIGLLFIFISLKRSGNKIVGIDFGSLAFIVMILGIVIGTFLTIFGLVKLLVAKNKQRIIIKKINDLK